MRRFDPKDLEPGDHLIYWDGSLVDWVIALKTFSRRAGHIEIFRRWPHVWASRAGGVNEYMFRAGGLQAVLRPKGDIDWKTVDRWFWKIAGEVGYDWLGLCCFTLAVAQGAPDKMFCSEFATHFDRKAGLEPFNPRWPADLVAPGMFMQSPAFKIVWDAGHDNYLKAAA